MSQLGKTPSDKSRPAVTPPRLRFDAAHARPIRSPHYPPSKESRQDR
jgi:hypothetical protein